MSKETNYTSIFDAPINTTEKKPRKNKKTTALIAAVLAVCVLGAVAFAVVKFLPKKAELTDEGRAVLTLQEGDITEVNSTFGENKITLKKEGGKWFYGEQDVTENMAVKALISRCSAVMALKTMPSNKGDYGFGNPYAKVSFKAGGKNYTLTFGNTINDGYAYYFKVSGDDKVYLMLKTVTEEYTISADDLSKSSAETQGADMLA